MSDDPISQPHTYPGRPPAGAGVLVDDRFLPFDDHDVSVTQGRTPVVAIGSNASPAQLRRKLRSASASSVVVPMTRLTADVVPGVSAHVSAHGYLPATPVAVEGAASELFVIWLDAEQLDIVDATEPNYDRVPFSDERFWIYRSKHGCLTDRAGLPRRLSDQRTLVTELLDDVPRLRDLCGDTYERFLEAVADDTTRRLVRRMFVAEGLVSTDPCAAT